MSKKFTKPAPYMVQSDGYPTAQAAKWVRDTFKPLMAKRLPTVLYSGFKHGYVVNYVQKHKNEFPYFLKIDIEKFYPSISHHYLTVETQLAYKKLLGLNYVPKRFKEKLLPALHSWYGTLPTPYQGIPLNSAMSKAIAPLMLVPFFLDLKYRESCKFVVYADDILLLTKSKQEATKLYFELLHHLNSISLDINKSKVQQGRFASGVVDFIGYRFAGGSVSITPEKVAAFKQDFSLRCQTLPKPFNERVYIKNLNKKIAGFGHYYKCGNVVGVYEKLDSFIRGQLRVQYKTMGLPFPSNAQLHALGLCSLAQLKKGNKQQLIPQQAYHYKQAEAREKHHQKTKDDLLYNYLEHFDNQNKQIIGLLTKLVATQEAMLRYF